MIADTNTLYVDSTDNRVGIGMTNPSRRLDVSGQIHATDDICTDVGGGTCLGNASGDITSVKAGTGLTGGGTSGNVTLNANTTYLQRRVTGTCSTGNSIRAVNSDGTVTCEADDNAGLSCTNVIQYHVPLDDPIEIYCPAGYTAIFGFAGDTLVYLGSGEYPYGSQTLYLIPSASSATGIRSTGTGTPGLYWVLMGVRCCK